MIKARIISKGREKGEIVFSDKPVSFFGGVDPETGIVVEKGHPLEGQSVSGKILVFPYGKGSTVGSYVLYRLKKCGKAPLALVVENCETIIATGAIISGIPCVDKVDISQLKNRKELTVDADNGEIF